MKTSAMKIMVIGGGGREHALAWKLKQSPRVAEVIVVPGNAGTALEPGVRNVAGDVSDILALLKIAQAEKIDLAVVGPEVPLVAGVVDLFSENGLRCFGPRKAAAQLEGSKAFSKDFLARYKIPSAEYQVFTELNPALEYVRKKGAPIVIKADGLAAGKGVVVATDLAQAEAALVDMLGTGSFGEAGKRVVVEEFLAGEEASYIVICDGDRVLPLATSQDHKRRDNGDLGPNTGGMGAYSPAPVVTAQIEQRILDQVIYPTLNALKQEGTPFTGFLYAGIMLDSQGNPRVLEFNVRFGDPETQPILFRLRSDLLDLIDAALDGKLDQVSAQWDPRSALGVVMAAEGYPVKVRTGDVIQGLEQSLVDSKVFHSGTRTENGNAITAGGRVLTVCGLGDTLAQAQQNAYQAVAKISWPGEFHRHDIGWRALKS